MRSKGKSEPAKKADPMRALAALARARRKSLRVTQIELARLARCGPVFVYDLEAGKKTLRLDKLLDVLEVLGLELAVEEGHGRLRVSGASRAARS